MRLDKKDELAIYIHYPFCKSKCPYCDFNSHVKDKIDYRRFLKAYKTELDFFSQKIGKRKITSIFFGGGTPSLMPNFLIAEILDKISKLWQVESNCEITLEANPTSIESAKFSELKKIGINRLSLGIQALNDTDLKFLGREHSANEALNAISLAQKFFDNFSFDLIYARPNQTISSWKKELERALDFQSKHISLYQLTIEKGTKFFSQFQKGEIILPDENLAIELYNLTYEIAYNKGLELYEISNYAKKDFQCHHNLSYWQGKDYIGIGAGAHSRVYFEEHSERLAIMMKNDPNSWLNSVEKNSAGIQTQTKISLYELAEELILMGLRLTSGIHEKIFVQHLQKKFSQIFDIQKIKSLEKQGLIFLKNKTLQIPPNQRLITNSIIYKVCQTLTSF